MAKESKKSEDRTFYEISAAAVVIVIIAVFVYVWMSGSDGEGSIPSDAITLKDKQIFDSNKGIVLENALGGDFQWQSNYFKESQAGGILNFWSVNYPRAGNMIHKSMHVIIGSGELSEVTKEDCINTKYGISKDLDYNLNLIKNWHYAHYGLGIKDGDVLCFSVDDDIDGDFGDRVFAIKVLSHTTSLDGKSPGSITFDYKVFD